MGTEMGDSIALTISMDKQQIDAIATQMLRNFISTLADYLVESMDIKEMGITEDEGKAIIERAMDMWDYKIDV